MSRHSRDVNTAAGRHFLFMLIMTTGTYIYNIIIYTHVMLTWILQAAFTTVLYPSPVYTFCFRSACRPDAGQLHSPPATSQLHSPPAASKVSYTAILLQVSYTALLLLLTALLRHTALISVQVSHTTLILKSVTQPSYCKSVTQPSCCKISTALLQVSYTALLLVSLLQVSYTALYICCFVS